MKPSEVEAETTSEGTNVPINSTTHRAPTPDRTSIMEPKKGSQKAAPKISDGQDETKAGKLSGAELKKKAKEEKAAKRAREKQNQPPSEALSNISKKSSAPPGKEGHASKQQHKKTGSITANSSIPLALRQGEPKIPSVPPAANKENKHVALFGHLCGSPRRTTIAGAGRDVHPAVLALGLQMSNYVICGSSARCVATLLVFKRVSYSSPRLVSQLTEA